MALNINGTTGISGIDGSASTPALQGSDSNTGVSFGTDTVNINTGGVERLQINSQGKPTFNTSGGDDAVLVKGDTFTGVRIQAARDDSSDHAMFQMLASRGTNASPTILQSGDTLGTLTARGYDGNSYAESSNIKFVVDGTPSDGDMPSRITFNTSADGSQSPTERMRIDSSGRVFVGTTNTAPHTDGSGVVIHPTAGVLVGVKSTHAAIFARHDSDGECVRFQRANTDVGSIDVSSSSTSYNTSSDYRLKENVVAISDGITRLKTLKPSRFNFKVDKDTTVDGFLAHEVTAVPEAITGTKDEVDSDNNPIYQGIDQSKLVPLLTAALQEAVAKIEVLETKVAALEAA
jgi:hypothetical protein